MKKKKFNEVPYPYRHELVLTIESLSNMGYGVARDEGWVVFVPYALPGDKVRARVWKNEKNCSHADLVEVLEEGTERIKPECALFGTCGGCQYQMMPYEEQLAWKRRQVAELLALQTGISAEVGEAIGSPREYGYRSKITPHFQRPKVERGAPAIGFLKTSSRFDVVDVPYCPIAMDCLNAALPRLRAQVVANAASYAKGATLLLRASDGGERVETNPRSVATEQVGDLTFHFLAGDFFQNNPYILPLFTEYVAARASAHGERYLVDAYCGSGLFALTLARHFEHVAGVEVSETSADWARKNAEVNGIENVSFKAASAEAIFGDIDFPGSETAVIIDPPRKGCDKVFLDQLFMFGPSTVVYVSCNPATQIRDLAHFEEAGYEVTDIRPFDLFPQTKHLECIVTLRKKLSSDKKVLPPV